MVWNTNYEATIRIGGQSRDEYSHNTISELVHEDGPRTAIRYIEAVAGAEFSVVIHAEKNHSGLRKAEAIAVQVLVDGVEQAWTLGFRDKHYMTVIRGRSVQRDGGHYDQTFCFSKVITGQLCQNMIGGL